MSQIEKRTIQAKTPEIRFEFADHFPIRLIQKAFDLSALVPLYSELTRSKIGQEVEVCIGHTTVVAIRIATDRAKLITGWKGSR